MLELHGISKRFGDVQANRDISLTVEEGEVHGLVGENGAGKTTLMNILYGLYQPDGGEIRLRGRPLTMAAPEDAIGVGIGMVHQQFMLVPTLTVVENIALGMRRSAVRRLRLGPLADSITRVAENHGLEVDPWTRVDKLSVGQKQRVEIVKTLERGADLVILDEPTSVLAPQEVQELFKVLRRLADDGKSVIFISHKLEEVLAVCDRITVLRGGALQETVERPEATAAGLARAMVGPVDTDVRRPETTADEDVLVRVEDLSVADASGILRVRDASFEIRRGEIFGIAGVSGNGQGDLVRALYGLETIVQGRVWIGDRETTACQPLDLITLGVGYVPEDRARDGLVADFDVQENLLLKDYRFPPYCRRYLLDRNAIRERAAQLVEEYGVRAAGIGQRLAELSGGNQQRVVLARELSREPVFLIASQPTQGLDIRSQVYVERLLLGYRERGAAILLVSTELEEVRTLCDRTAVMSGGRITGVVDPRATSAEDFGVLMGGGRAAA